jgi:hypothetical protein
MIIYRMRTQITVKKNMEATLDTNNNNKMYMKINVYTTFILQQLYAIYYTLGRNEVRHMHIISLNTQQDAIFEVTNEDVHISEESGCRFWSRHQTRGQIREDIY